MRSLMYRPNGIKALAQYNIVRGGVLEANLSTEEHLLLSRGLRWSHLHQMAHNSP